MKVHKISGGIFVFGIAYALTIVGRGAPMLISALSLVAFGGDFFTGGACADYLLLLPRNPLTIFAVAMETLKTERKKKVLRRSAILDRVTGVLLSVLGVYYIISALLPSQ